MVNWLAFLVSLPHPAVDSLEVSRVRADVKEFAVDPQLPHLGSNSQ